MRYLLLISVFVGPVLTDLQAQSSVEQTAIDDQVWRPFVDTWSNFKAAEFNALHTDDIIRVWGNGMRIGEEYKQHSTTKFPEQQKRGDKRTIQFTFESRVASGDVAYEVGYYKVNTVDNAGDQRTFYGRFHVVLRRTQGVWKIAQDWDTDEVMGQKVGAEHFNSGTPLSNS